MPKGFDALAAIVAQHLKLNLLSGQLFLFFNRRGDKMKILTGNVIAWRSGTEGLNKGTIRYLRANPASPVSKCEPKS
jgi:transposase